ncbi:DoxX family protein [Chitinophaga sancti]|uniref:DoxX family protein n=1 Tax=Chitinophaga sancti TaxID=1004 RepID=A0A1K1QTK5_9BACT|nr:DoxX family protein [Chitinophaga sancti]WQD61927.1 DoxX family protein [Chitinophaga sancti]WQG92504.1 DoxX family protein [Chitinophaga sancti]SFW63247.1 putative oxidoreductase [Chitinophaga sancti]
MSKLFSSKASNGAINFSLLLLRIAFGGLLLWNHGLGKLKGFSAMKDSFPDPLHIGHPISLGLAVFAEVFCAGLVIIGLATRLATVPVIVTMGVALFLIHGHQALKEQEPAILYLVPFLVILFAGPGKVSLDNAIGK